VPIAPQAVIVLPEPNVQLEQAAYQPADVQAWLVARPTHSVRHAQAALRLPLPQPDPHALQERPVQQETGA